MTAQKTDWPVIEEDLLKLSDKATRERESQKMPDEINSLLAEAGLSASPDAPEKVDLTPQEKLLFDMQRADTLATLKALSEGVLKKLKIDDARKALLKTDNLPEEGRVEALKKLRDAEKEITEKIEEVAESSPEAYLAITTRTLRQYVTQFHRGRIVETAQVQEGIEQLVDDLSKAKIPFIYGETGTGKTELARIAAKRFSDKDPLVVRGYAGMGSQELYGHQELTQAELSDVKAIRERLDQFKEIHPEATVEEERALTASLLNDKGITISKYVLGAVYVGAEEGRPVIFDEGNYIPPELIAKANDITTKRPGEYINVQEDGIDPIKVTEGFGIIFTGNINVDPKDKRYIGRFDFDPAFLDRVSLMEYQGLPQGIEGSPQNFKANDKQLFQIAVVSMISRNQGYRGDPQATVPNRMLERIENRHGSLYVPGGSAGLTKIWNLSKLAAVTQAAFAGKIDSSDVHSHTVNGTSVGYRPDIQISPRVLMSILSDWKQDGFKYELDHYVGRALIERATKTLDREYLYKRGQHFGFFKDGNWPQDAPPVKSVKQDAESIEFVPGREVIEALFESIPERTSYPSNEAEEAKQQEQTAEAIAIQMEAEQLLAEAENLLAPFKAIFEPDEEATDSKTSDDTQN